MRSCNLQINEEREGIITDIAERYVKAMIWNINERFPSDVLEVLDAFSIANLGKFLMITHPMNLLCTILVS